MVKNIQGVYLSDRQTCNKCKEYKYNSESKSNAESKMPQLRAVEKRDRNIGQKKQHTKGAESNLFKFLKESVRNYYQKLPNSLDSGASWNYLRSGISNIYICRDIGLHLYKPGFLQNPRNAMRCRFQTCMVIVQQTSGHGAGFFQSHSF